MKLFRNCIILWLLTGSFVFCASRCHGQMSLRSGTFVAVATRPASGAAFSPADVSGLYIWLKSESLSGSAGSEVTSWADSSGNSRNFTSDTGPALSNIVGQVSGSNFVSYTTGSAQFLTNRTFTLSQPVTVFVVARARSVTASSRIMMDGDDSAGRLSLLMNYNAETGRFGITGPTAYGGDVVSAGTWYLFEATFNGASSITYTNGVTSVAAGNAGTGNAIGLTLGNRYIDNSTGFDGDVAEFLVYNADVSSGNRASIRSFLNTKFGLWSGF